MPDNNISTIRQRIRAFRYHRAHASAAAGIVETITSQKGPIPRRLVNQCDDYAKTVLGSKIYAPWLYVYSALSGEFQEGWIPDNYYGAIIIPRLKGHHGEISSLKSMSGRMFSSTMFPDIAYLINGRLFDASYTLVSGEQQAQTVLFGGGDRIVFKKDLSSRGDGIVFFDEKTWSSGCLATLGNGVFQRNIIQHPFLSSFGSGAVATLRLTTLVDAFGKVSLRAAYLRFGASGDRQVMSASHIRVPVDLESGQLAPTGYMPDWRKVVAHPESGKSFAGQVMPSFRQCVDTVIALHRQVPFVACIGWDVAVNHNGDVEVMEWNGEHNDIKFGEATQGPCFADQHWERLSGR